jgi:drug/metabolite transporter (DMT)-like permease
MAISSWRWSGKLANKFAMMLPPSPLAEQPSFRRIFLVLLFGIVAIGYSPIVVRLSELPPTATAFHRVFLAMPFLWLWMEIGKRRVWAHTQPAARRDYGLLLFAGLAFAWDLVFWHWSLNLTSVANAVLLANFTPIFVTAASFLLWGERFSPVFLLGVALAVGGAAIVYTTYILLVGRLRRRFASATILAWTSLLTIIVLLVVTLAMGEPLVATTLTGWLILLGLALISPARGINVCQSAATASGSDYLGLDFLKRTPKFLAGGRRYGNRQGHRRRRPGKPLTRIAQAEIEKSMLVPCEK